MSKRERLLPKRVHTDNFREIGRLSDSDERWLNAFRLQTWSLAADKRDSDRRKRVFDE